MFFLSTSLTKDSEVTPPFLVYTATRDAVEQLSRVLAEELGVEGIAVNTVYPGKS